MSVTRETRLLEALFHLSGPCDDPGALVDRAIPADRRDGTGPCHAELDDPHNWCPACVATVVLAAVWRDALAEAEERIEITIEARPPLGADVVSWRQGFAAGQVAKR